MGHPLWSRFLADVNDQPVGSCRGTDPGRLAPHPRSPPLPEALFALTGATGNIGKDITSTLLVGRQRVRAIGRDAARLRPAFPQAEPFAASVRGRGSEFWVLSSEFSV